MAEIKNEEVMEIIPMEYEDDYETEDLDEEERGNLGKVILAGGTILVGTAAAVAIKKRKTIAEKLKQRKIEKLEAEGFVVIRPENMVDGNEDSDDEPVDESEE